jgi:hypothetical protein
MSRLYPKAPVGLASPDRPLLSSTSSMFAVKAEYLPDSGAAVADCNQDLWLTIFFDGTGNNEKIDRSTFEHSNVARLYRAALEDDEAVGRYRIYIPGIGTPFREVGDEGGNLDAALALTSGEERLKWAMEEVERIIKRAEARARNPVNKIRSINIALFGFSRGAALARAFARRIDEKCCRERGRGPMWKKGHYPTRLYFMGLFDTVASVGANAMLRKFSGEAAAASAASPLLGGLAVLVARNADGHMGWASNLRIPAMVEKCVHYCAAHEIRNSFPLDTVLEDGRYPANCTEAVYPGVHSNVGGGYRPGEGGRNRNQFAMLSLIPLKAMYDAAVKAGVPLQNIYTAESRVKDDFLPPEAGDIAARAELSARYNHYMTTVGWGGRPVGELITDHMKMYFRWRIIHVGRKIKAAKGGQLNWETRRLQAYDNALAGERQEQQAELARLERERAAALGASRYESLRWDVIMQQARVNTMPADADDLIAALDKYDRMFLDDSNVVLKADPARLRPFHRVLRNAWMEPALTDAKIIAFFDEYVTDSLAGFDTDRTRAIDPRWLYQGGDEMVDYAALAQPSPETAVA